MTFKIDKFDWQYLIPLSTIVFIFIGTDVFGLLEKMDLAYFSGRLFFQPYRILTSHFVHYDQNHLLANSFGIVIARYFLKELKLKSKSFVLALIPLLIVSQSCFQWLVDIYIFGNRMSLLIGFSGILYGINSFILLSSIYGKEKFLNLHIGLSRNPKVCNAISVLIGLGLCFSLLPKISLTGHLTGLVAGVLLFFF